MFSGTAVLLFSFRSVTTATAAHPIIRVLRGAGLGDSSFPARCGVAWLAAWLRERERENLMFICGVATNERSEVLCGCANHAAWTEL